MMTTNKLTKILTGVAVFGIASAIAAPAQAIGITGTLGWSNGTSDFFSDVNPGAGDTFSVTFSPDNITLISTATGVFNPEFDPASPPYIATTTATGNFIYNSANQTGLAAGEFRYELTGGPLAFVFPDPNGGSGASVTWATGTTFRGFFDTPNSVEFEVEGPLPTITGIAEIPPHFVVDDVLQFGDGVGPDGGVYDAQVEVSVPEPGTILGILAVGGLGLVSRLKKQK
ncbi:PEP-CTERM sorting domain-containing protein [Microcystis aeruginosa]|uniref:Ice-binding protein C-terminal domain-containing protein n=1 Tax=Microcystis aeruginosa NIES-2521 TaxID=2303983 RepID=A0A5A5S2K2_MICAE|nr:PEP-CTERM sorting domain-containing protein [Microcystis aeruginosa]GCA79691.1 hypothetical protein MiTs_01685 [Microcystis aeruginosa NIES-2521]